MAEAVVRMARDSPYGVVLPSAGRNAMGVEGAAVVPGYLQAVQTSPLATIHPRRWSMSALPYSRQPRICLGRSWRGERLSLLIVGLPSQQALAASIPDWRTNSKN